MPRSRQSTRVGSGRHPRDSRRSPCSSTSTVSRPRWARRTSKRGGSSGWGRAQRRAGSAGASDSLPFDFTFSMRLWRDWRHPSPQPSSCASESSAPTAVTERADAGLSRRLPRCMRSGRIVEEWGSASSGDTTRSEASRSTGSAVASFLGPESGLHILGPQPSVEEPGQEQLRLTAVEVCVCPNEPGRSEPRGAP